MIGFYNYTVWLTYLSLMSGTAGITLCLIYPDKPVIAVICLLFSGFCDLFDGKIARTKKDRTDDEKSFGIQIDSLTDLVCFGVLPAVIFITIVYKELNTMASWLLIIPIIYVLCGMIRLAYFNVLELSRQRTETELTNKFYWGLPITNASIIFSFSFFISNALYNKEIINGIGRIIIIAFTLVLLSALFIAKIKVPKFKKKGMTTLIVIGVIITILIILLELL